MNTSEDIVGWFRGRIPDVWFTEPVRVTVDRDEILVIGTVAPPDVGSDVGEDARSVAHSARIRGSREDTGEQGMRVAREGEPRLGGKVSGGAGCGDREELFTVAPFPAMTRLRLPERAVLDTLIDA